MANYVRHQPSEAEWTLLLRAIRFSRKRARRKPESAQQLADLEQRVEAWRERDARCREHWRSNTRRYRAERTDIRMTNATLIERIRKLLALSSSPNEHEAAAALCKARELLQKHHLDIASLGEAPDAEPVVTEPIGWVAKARNWRRQLAVCVAAHVYCRTIEAKRALHMVGRPDNVCAGLHLLRWIETQLLLISTAEGVANDAAFLYGAVLRIDQRLTAMRTVQDATPAATALVVQSATEIERHLADRFPRGLVEKGIGSWHMNTDSMQAGYAAGGRVDLQQTTLPSALRAIA